MPPTNLLPRVASKPKRPKVHYAEFMRIVRLHAISASGPAGSACHGYGFSASLSARQHRKQGLPSGRTQANQQEERCGGE
ncbi:hypothetical protein MTX26_33690 [Bradyrhizobium sp. ISRA443]|uniref:hypothetical protein n=1 Tax=unclassified Bradyrhizobium TaxID=2631580 RepID=UPI00247A4102|nr:MULTISPECIES: hypothetical protein [unclassified Bradyrhizobium]WGR99083.1 hypothetical protein MTX23_33670 [Bradyrhizobium sp. ISRA436]WGS05974.1 hypothetical protein MTX18_33690 [Bradyrhizobium sp. ISRA437]WGS12860.1 hypothetical protein MTX26_33690 [Bradyrhizobium sp. ISRA443]